MPDPTAAQRPPPRKSPRQARSLATVQAIVEGAARILERDGLQGFTTNAVAVEAGVSVGSLYQYFPRKEALIGALVVRETSQLVDDAEVAKLAPTGSQALSGLILACIAHQFRRPILARILDFEEARLPFDHDTLEVSRRFHAIVRDTLLRPDLTPQTDVETATRDVVAIIKGMVDTAGVQGEGDHHSLAERIERAISGYLRTPFGRAESYAH